MNSPNHVAIIMDGNGRWGIKKRKSSNESLNKFSYKLKQSKKSFQFGGLRNKGGQ